jgi:cellobiose phosphorylase
MSMHFGHYDDERREYVITRPDTPLPWINYLGSEAYFGIISNTAGGYSFYQDARLRRLTRYRYNGVPSDAGGRYLYLRDDADGTFWSPTWQPTRTDLDSYECRHGLGYTVISSRFAGIEASIRYFVPVGENLEVWDLTLTNTRDAAAELSLFSALEFALWDANDDATNFQRNFNIGEVEVVDGVIYHKTEYRERRDHFAFFACSEQPSGFDTQRRSFLGPYRGWEAPAVVEQGEATNSLAVGWAPFGSHHVRVGLQPGERRRILFVLGYQENPRDRKFDPPGSQVINKETVLPVISRQLDPAHVDRQFADLAASWNRILDSLRVDTPDVHANRMINTWNAYQNMVTFNLSRSASLFESGVGRGIGFRDSNQDLLGFVHLVPERARERLVDLASTQFADGSAYHQYQPLTKRGNDAVGTGFNDDPLWLVIAVAAYLKETGDWSLLDTPAPFDSLPGTEVPIEEHLRRSLGFTLANLGPHRLPLIGRADWNDCLNLNTFSEEPGEGFQTATTRDGKVAESVLIAGLFVLAAREMAAIAERRGHGDEAEEYRRAADRMVATVDEHGWDGEWFLRAYDAFGEPLGSASCTEGQIFIESQGMCGMAGIGREDGRLARAMEAVHDRLATPHGIVVHQPAFTHYPPRLGEISSYPPGYKENAGVFCHANPWIMISETMLGHADQALDYYLRINPSAREDLSEIHRTEPYVYAQMIAGKDAPTHGEAKNSWLTGTAAWNYVAVTQWILGIRPEHDGLRVHPVVPASWDGFTATRVFRGVTYLIRVRRTGPGGEVTVRCDDAAVDGDLVAVPTDRDQVTVEVEIG